MEHIPIFTKPTNVSNLESGNGSNISINDKDHDINTIM